MKLNFSEACSLATKTMPYMFARLAVYAVVGVGASVYFLVVLLIAKVFGGAGVIFFLIALAVFLGLMRLVQRYVLYLIRAGHVAVITELMDSGKLPEGTGQFGYGKEKIMGEFKEVSVLFVVNELVDGIIKAFNRKIANIAEWLPIPGLEGLAKGLGLVLNVSVTYIDEAILSYNLSKKDESIWTSARDGVILYAQSWKEILKSASVMALITYGGLVVFFLLLLIPFGLIALAIPSIKAFSFITALIFAFVIKLAFLDPLGMTAMILTFRKEIEGKEVNKEWEERLDQASTKFKELKEKAAQAFKGQPGPETPQTAS